MTPDDMARELRADGWEQDRLGKWWPRASGQFVSREYGLSLLGAWEELAQQRAQGTVTTPVVGEEEK